MQWEGAYTLYTELLENSTNKLLFSINQHDGHLHIWQVAFSMDNFRRGLYSHMGAGAKTSLGVCLIELKHYKLV
jgi:hypothetical protein